MNYDQFNDKQKQAIQIIMNWGMNLKKEEVKKLACYCEECREDFRFKGADNNWHCALTNIDALCNLLWLPAEEKKNVINFAKSKNFWMNKSIHS